MSPLHRPSQHARSRRGHNHLDRGIGHNVKRPRTPWGLLRRCGHALFTEMRAVSSLLDLTVRGFTWMPVIYAATLSGQSAISNPRFFRESAVVALETTPRR